jgi:hypothetical protein
MSPFSAAPIFGLSSFTFNTHSAFSAPFFMLSLSYCPIFWHGAHMLPQLPIHNAIDHQPLPPSPPPHTLVRQKHDKIVTERTPTIRAGTRLLKYK